MKRMKSCRGCQAEKPLSDFPPNRNQKDGVQTRCRVCYKEDRRIYKAANLELVAEQARRSALKKLYGLTVEDYEGMLHAQDSSCAICGHGFSARPHVDHCHSSGVIRGLLCQNCNLAIGLLKDNPDRCRSAAKYLEKQHHTPQGAT